MTDRRGAALVYLDTNIFIDFVQGEPTQMERLKRLFEKFRLNPKTAVTSEFSLGEIFGRKAPGLDWAAQKAFYLGLLVFNDFIDLHPVTRDILIETGELRYSAALSGRRIKLPDAIHVVTAKNAGCRFFLSSDKRITVPALQTIAPDIDGMREIDAALDA